VKVLSSAQSQLAIAEQLGISMPEQTHVPDDQIVAEYIRQVLSDLLISTSEGASGVYVTRITNRVRMQLAPVWPILERRVETRPSLRFQEAEGDMQPDPIRRVLESLDDLREVAHLGHGYWTTTPLRFVRIGEQSTLVVSGETTGRLRKTISRLIQPSWIARTIQWGDLPERLKSDPRNVESRESWLGAPPGDLALWTQQLLTRARGGLAISGANLTEFEIYVPSLHRGKAQAFRWITAKELRLVPDGIQFCRATEGNYFRMRRYWLGIVVRSRAGFRAESEYPVDHSEMRRTQYGFDLIASAPTIVKLKRMQSSRELTFTNLLPAEERRALVAFGRERSARLGRFPLVYELEKQPLEQFILPLLQGLGIRVVAE